MANTTNYKMTLPTYTSSADINVLNENFKTIDNGIVPFYVATSNNINVYKITTGLNLTSLSNGFSVKVAIPNNSDTTYTYMKLVVDSCGEVLIKKPNGNNLVNFKANGVYNLTYYNSVFICASGSVDDVSFTSDKLLTGYSANDSNGEKVDGTMAERGTVTQTQTLNGTMTLPEGHYNSINITQNIPTKSSITNSLSTGWDGVYTYARIPQSAYFTNATSGYPEIKTNFTDIANTVGLTPDKLVGTIGGVVGTATIESLGGRKVYMDTQTFTVPTNTSTINVNIGFRPNTVIVQPYSGSNLSAETWIHGRSDTFGWLTHAFKDYQSSSSSSYTPTTQIDSFTDTGFVYRVQQSGNSYATNMPVKLEIIAIK